MDITGSTKDNELQYSIEGNPFYRLQQLLAKQKVWNHDLERLTLMLGRFATGGNANQIRYTSAEIKKAQINLRDLALEIADVQQQITERTNQALADAARVVAAMYKAA